MLHILWLIQEDAEGLLSVAFLFPVDSNVPQIFTGGLLRARHCALCWGLQDTTDKKLMGFASFKEGGKISRLMTDQPNPDSSWNLFLRERKEGKEERCLWGLSTTEDSECHLQEAGRQQCELTPISEQLFSNCKMCRFETGYCGYSAICYFTEFALTWFSLLRLDMLNATFKNWKKAGRKLRHESSIFIIRQR